MRASATPTETHQALLQLPSSEMAELSRMVPALPVTYVLQCSDLCEDFHEDLQFHFSLGLNSLLVVPPLPLPPTPPLTAPSPAGCGQLWVVAQLSEDPAVLGAVDCLSGVRGASCSSGSCPASECSVPGGGYCSVMSCVHTAAAVPECACAGTIAPGAGGSVQL